MVTVCVTPVLHWRTRRIAALLLAGALASGQSVAIAQTQSQTTTPQGQTAKPQPPTPDTNVEAKALADFQVRLKEYLALHEKFEGTLPKLPDRATPQEIDRHQRLFAPLIQKARAGAKQGDVFTPEMQLFVRKITRRAFSGPDGKQMISSILDENPVGLKIAINSRYPDEVPLSTMPPDLLAALPKLPPELEFRFVGDRMILHDKHAHIIIDWVDNVLPLKPAGDSR